MNTPIGDRLFQDIPRRLAKFNENRLRDVEKPTDGKNIKKLHDQNIIDFAYRYSDTRVITYDDIFVF